MNRCHDRINAQVVQIPIISNEL